jgi:hypothetical protein
LGPLGAALVLVVVVSGCALDTRELQLETSSFAGSASTGGGGSGGGGGIGQPLGLDAPPPPACVYAGTEVPAGCETLVSNPGFDQESGVEGWPGANLRIQTEWRKQDATGVLHSGSMAVDNTLAADSNGDTINGAFQCVPAVAGAVYDVAADVFIPSGQEAAGRAGISVLFYKTADCNASLTGTDMSFTTTLVDAVARWQPVAGRFVVPDGMSSMEITLVSGKPFRPLSFTALFDNVLVQKK